MFDTAMLAVPTFPRLEEYAGVWAYEPARFAVLTDYMRSFDFARHMAAGPPPPRQSTVRTAPAKGGQSVAIIEAAGTLMKQQPSVGGTSTIQLRRDIRTAANDPTVSAILLAVDSPGGTVSGTEDLAADVRAAAKIKPVWGHIDGTGASAAYWFVSQADMVYASGGTTLVGSIGAFQTVVDSSEAAAKEGVKVLVFRTGPVKGAGVPGTEITDDQKAMFQGLVDSAQQYFDAAVRSGRGISAAELAAVKSGEVFPAKAAMDRKLIDGIRPLDATLAALIKVT